MMTFSVGRPGHVIPPTHKPSKFMKQKHCSYLINFIIVNFFFISFICLLSATKPGSDLVSVSEIKHGIQDGLLQTSMTGFGRATIAGSSTVN